MVKGKPYGLMNHIPEGYLTRGQVALEIGKSKDTIKRWHISGRFVATHTVRRGKHTVFLYDQDDLKVLKQLARTVRPGRQTHGD